MKKAVLILIFVFLTSLSFAYDSEVARESLKGIEGFQITIDIEQELEDFGLDKETVKTDTELKLRLAEIKIIDEIDIDKNHALLSVSISSAIYESICAYTIQMAVSQPAILLRDAAILAGAETWSIGIIGVTGHNHRNIIREAFKDLVDRFLNAYLSVNPK